MITVEECSRLPTGSSGHTELDLTNRPILPKTYLSFATQDLSQPNTDRSRINALANAKRAIQCQVEIIAAAFGLHKLPSGERQHFPQKLEFCKRCGVIGPRVLNKLNYVRNQMEHEYHVPARDEVEDFVDVAELFLDATNYILYHFPIEVEFGSLEEVDHPLAYVMINMEPQQGEVIVSGWVENSEAKNFKQVAAEKEKIDQDLDLKRKEGKKVVLLADIRDLARNRAASPLRAEFTKSYKVGADPGYFDWVRLCVETSRGS
jgi:hypothetical protein